MVIFWRLLRWRQLWQTIHYFRNPGLQRLYNFIQILNRHKWNFRLGRTMKFPTVGALTEFLASFVCIVAVVIQLGFNLRFSPMIYLFAHSCFCQRCKHYMYRVSQKKISLKIHLYWIKIRTDKRRFLKKNRVKTWKSAGGCRTGCRKRPPTLPPASSCWLSYFVYICLKNFLLFVRILVQI